MEFDLRPFSNATNGGGLFKKLSIYFLYSIQKKIGGVLWVSIPVI